MKGRIPDQGVPVEGYPAHSRGRWGGSAATHHTQGYSSGPCTDSDRHTTIRIVPTSATGQQLLPRIQILGSITETAKDN
jgi:hypothetical protein